MQQRDFLLNIILMKQVIKTSAAPAPAASEGSYDSQYNNAAANKLQNIQSWDDL